MKIRVVLAGLVVFLSGTGIALSQDVATPCDPVLLAQIEAKAKIEKAFVWHLPTLGSQPAINPDLFPSRGKVEFAKFFIGPADFESVAEKEKWQDASETVWLSIGRGFFEADQPSGEFKSALLDAVNNDRFQKTVLPCGTKITFMTFGTKVVDGKKRLLVLRNGYIGFNAPSFVVEQIGGQQVAMIDKCGNIVSLASPVPVEVPPVLPPVLPPVVPPVVVQRQPPQAPVEQRVEVEFRKLFQKNGKIVDPPRHFEARIEFLDNSGLVLDSISLKDNIRVRKTFVVGETVVVHERPISGLKGWRGEDQKAAVTPDLDHIDFVNTKETTGLCSGPKRKTICFLIGGGALGTAAYFGLRHHEQKPVASVPQQPQEPGKTGGPGTRPEGRPNGKRLVFKIALTLGRR